MAPGIWKLAGSWDWDPVVVLGDLDIRPLSTVESARLSSDSQDKLTQAAGKIPLRLEGSDFQFVEKVAFKSLDDKFAQPAPLPFSLPAGPRSGREASLETQIDAKPLASG